MVSSRVLFIFLYKTVVGSFIIFYPGGALEINENKICSRLPLTIEPSTQSQVALQMNFIGGCYHDWFF